MVESRGLPGSVMSAPYYRQVLDDLRRRITTGEFPPGAKLPSVRELVEYYQHAFRAPTLSRFPVRRAIDIMIEAGELDGQQGLGIYVTRRGQPGA